MTQNNSIQVYTKNTLFTIPNSNSVSLLPNTGFTGSYFPRPVNWTEHCSVHGPCYFLFHVISK